MLDCQIDVLVGCWWYIMLMSCEISDCQYRSEVRLAGPEVTTECYSAFLPASAADYDQLTNTKTFTSHGD